ncbi:MAG: MlaD family protein [Rhodospirillaceae bacterium]|nr:MlaD family protein [Rhodospirillaceae bacterium]
MLIHNENTRNAVVGAVVLGVLVVSMMLSYGGSKLSDKAQVGTYEVTAVFNQVDGLFEGDEIRLGGLRVGKVGKQVLDKNFRAVVTLNINNGVGLPLDSSAAIHTDGLFGSKFVVLDPGGEMEVLKAGGTIDYTQDAVIVSDLLDLIISEGKAKKEASKKGN